MKMEPFTKNDVDSFLALARSGWWMVDRWEFDFLLSVSPGGCFVARDAGSTAVAFVTSLRHKNSGWIGNLIVRPDSRGKGIGEALFLKALQALKNDGVDTIWLTASALGRSLYEKHGFGRIDTINRWSGVGVGKEITMTGNSFTHVNTALDQLGWGDERYPLLHTVARRGVVEADADAFAILQSCGDGLQLGPWAARDSKAAARTASAAMERAPVGTKVYCDTPSGNHASAELLDRLGYRITGSNELMFAGARPDYRPEFIYGLATMGSCG